MNTSNFTETPGGWPRGYQEHDYTYTYIVAQVLALVLVDTLALRWCVRAVVWIAVECMWLTEKCMGEARHSALRGFRALSAVDQLQLGRCMRELYQTGIEVLRFSADVLELAGDFAAYVRGLLDTNSFANAVSGALLIGGLFCSAYAALLLVNQALLVCCLWMPRIVSPSEQLLN